MLGLAMTIRGLPIPVIAMVNGWCMGGGHELALWCDVVIASENAVLGQTGAKVGACPTVGATQYLPRIIGDKKAREMILLGEIIDANEALRIGLVSQVAPSGELNQQTDAVLAKLRELSSSALQFTRTALEAGRRGNSLLVHRRRASPRTADMFLPLAHQGHSSGHYPLLPKN